MTFTQTMSVQADRVESLADLLDGWHHEQDGTAPGYLGARLLADQDQPGSFLIEVDFASKSDAEKNNTRPETQAWADKLRSVAQGEPGYHNYIVAYSTR